RGARSRSRSSPASRLSAAGLSSGAGRTCMIDRIRLGENVACEVLPEGCVFVSENGSRLLAGRAARLVAGLLDGSSTLDVMIERLAGEASAAEGCFIVERLKRDGLVVSGARVDDPER